MDTTADVVVVGAGAVGAAGAYSLAEAGPRVVLVEQAAIASGASTHATGFFSLLATDFKTENHLRLGIESYRLARASVPVLEELTGMDLLYQLRPSLRLALEEVEEEVIRASLDGPGRLLEAKWIDGDEVRRIEPRLSPNVRGAAFEAESAQIDSGR